MLRKVHGRQWQSSNNSASQNKQLWRHINPLPVRRKPVLPLLQLNLKLATNCHVLHHHHTCRVIATALSPNIRKMVLHRPTPHTINRPTRLLTTTCQLGTCQVRITRNAIFRICHRRANGFSTILVGRRTCLITPTSRCTNLQVRRIMFIHRN